MIYLINNDGYRLCKDKRWRTFAMFGTYPSCVKIYRQKGSAINLAKKLKARVVELPEGGQERILFVDDEPTLLEIGSDGTIGQAVRVGGGL